jgi:hypothetical protein
MTTETKTRVITLTNRAPVRINEDDWHVIAEGSVYAGQFENQANRRAFVDDVGGDDGVLLKLTQLERARRIYGEGSHLGVTL